ncbi:MAG TPA: glycerol-3-phosphate dehydrogenase [Woeseiaceae bacterium]|nr:glycerol-3-phosphate dehydrogenase [Woeseiaceae bacterium]
MNERDQRFDVVIIGGCINGAGIARDAATRGMNVLLLEMNDFGSGTSSWSSRLIHGGLRYLEYGEIPLVYESLQERRRLRRMARHLVDSIRINIPIYQGGKRGMLMLRAGMLAYDLLSIGKSVSRHRMLSRSEFLENEPGVSANGLKGGAQYYDAQVTFAERLVIENVIAAQSAGAVVRNYSAATAIAIEQGKVRAVRYTDAALGQEVEVGARVVVNAAGPWVDQVLATANRPMPELMGGTKGSHIIVGRFEGAPKDAFYVEAYIDARPFFVIPWNGQYLIGTTDIRYKGDPGEARASDAEIDYLLSETNRVFPRARLAKGDIHFAYAGVRPLPIQSKKAESAITRRHIIRNHQRNARGLLSVIGGKLTTYRSLAEQVTDRVAKMLGGAANDCRTRLGFLPGAMGVAAAEADVRNFDGLSAEGAARLLHVYGGRARKVLDLAYEQPELAVALDDSRTVLAAEVAFAVREEFARHLTDILHRRTMLGLSPDLGESVAEAVAGVAAKELGWTEEETRRELQALRAYNARLKVRDL